MASLIGLMWLMALPDAKEGERRLLEGRFSEAIESLEGCLESADDPACAFNLAVAHRGVGDFIQAEATLLALLKGDYGPVPKRWRLQSEDLLRETSGKVAALRFAISPGPASVTLRWNGSVIHDGEVAAALSLRANPGRHTLSAVAPLYHALERTVDVEAGARLEIPISLVLDRAALIGTIVVEAPSATDRVEIEGEAVGVGRLVRDLLPGVYRVRVSRDGDAEERSVVLAAGEKLRLELDPSRTSSLIESPWFWVTSSVATAGIAAASYFLFRGDEAPPLVQNQRIGVIEAGR